jgi:hypothetical protein
MRLQQVAIRDYCPVPATGAAATGSGAADPRKALLRAIDLAGNTDVGANRPGTRCGLAWDQGVVTVLQRHTGLPHRMLFMTVGTAIERAHRHGNWFALVYLDADRFKLINDTGATPPAMPCSPPSPNA